MEHWHIDALRDEDDHVRRRCSAVAVAPAEEPFRVRRRAAAEMLGIGLRHLYRLLARFKKEGIKGLRERSRRPHSSPEQIDDGLASRIAAVREVTGFGPGPIADLLNESERRSGPDRRIWASTVYNVLVRTGLIEKEERIQKRWKRFERGRPGQLLQADLTLFNGVNVLTLEDDRSRKAWSLALPDALDDTVIGGMRALLTKRYDNLLTDNGGQFSRSDQLMREYCAEMLRGRHIGASSHHPQTLGKLGAYQKALKRFLTHRLGDRRDVVGINAEIDRYNDYYNNLRHHSGIGAVPGSRYSGSVDGRSYDRFVRNMNLEGVLALWTGRVTYVLGLHSIFTGPRN